MSNNAEIQPDGCLSGIVKMLLVACLALSPWIIVYFICKAMKVKRPTLVVLCGILVFSGVVMYTDPLNTYDNLVTNAYGNTRLYRTTLSSTLFGTFGVPLMVMHMFNGANTLTTVIHGNDVYKRTSNPANINKWWIDAGKPQKKYI